MARLVVCGSQQKDCTSENPLTEKPSIKKKPKLVLPLMKQARSDGSTASTASGASDGSAKSSEDFQEMVAIDSLTEIPLDLFESFAAAGQQARRRMQHAAVDGKPDLIRFDLVPRTPTARSAPPSFF
eukprot:CAMPEP_0115120848 /NCGR_PEP_ID=MMETSP0227-20121206/45921_1 /TAXON_ID=89957 /ORGANISM="Polarella glacialis, Strain CCMP 1383" /LENGTH=126 /DNA_ID=CAMNT_0002522567 /DNA_START=102 /DNA_END=482 /DNA_ORIENTATION=+